MVIKSKVDGSVVTIQVEGQADIVVDSAALTEQIRVYALADRVRNKLIDAGAKSRDAATGKPASAQDKYAAMVRVAEQLRAGQWNAARVGAVAKGPDVAGIVDAIALAFAVERADADGRVQADIARRVAGGLAANVAAAQTVAVLLRNAQVAAAYGQILAGRAGGAADDGGLLDGLTA